MIAPGPSLYALFPGCSTNGFGGTVEGPLLFGTAGTLTLCLLASAPSSSLAAGKKQKHYYHYYLQCQPRCVLQLAFPTRAGEGPKTPDLRPGNTHAHSQRHTSIVCMFCLYTRIHACPRSGIRCTLYITMCTWSWLFHGTTAEHRKYMHAYTHAYMHACIHASIHAYAHVQYIHYNTAHYNTS